jgi:hypothetical protein
VSRLAKIVALAATALLAGPAGVALAGPSGKLDFKNGTDGSVTWSTTPLTCIDGDSRLDAIDGLHQAPWSSESDEFYVEGRNLGDATSEDDQLALLQGWLIGGKRAGLTRTRMREASRALKGELGSGGGCLVKHSLFGIMAHDGPKFTAAVIRVSGCVVCTTSFSIVKQTGDLRLTVGPSGNPTVTVWPS